LLVWPSVHGNTISYAYAGSVSTLSSVRERDSIVCLGVNYMFAYSGGWNV
jgi:hypothetical protein